MSTDQVVATFLIVSIWIAALIGSVIATVRFL